MAGLLERLKLIGRSVDNDYTDVDLGLYEDGNSSAQMLMRVADLDKLEVLPEIKQEIYAGNIVLVDISGIKRDKTALDRAIGELKKTVDDVSGDIAGIGDDLVALVPHGIRIDREKVVGGRD